MRLIAILFLLSATLAEAGGRRVRHLNARDAGAVLVLDSRYISGLSDTDPVSTWSDRSGNGNDATYQNTAPTYKIAIQGGQPVVRLSANSGMSGSYNYTIGSELVIACFKSSTTGYYSRYFSHSDAGLDYDSGGYIPILKHNGSGDTLFGFFGGNYVSPLSYSNTFAIVAATTNGSTTTNFLNGTAGATASFSVSRTMTRYGFGVTNLSNFPELQRADGDICTIIAFASAASDPIRRRIEQFAAYSFKIACQ